MSVSRNVKYTCPYCGKEFEIEVWDSINAEEDPDLRDRCVSGDLFRVSCPHCKKEFMVQFPLVYIDKDHKFVLWLSQNEPGSDLKSLTDPLVSRGYTLRRCPTLQEFSEKIQILEDGADDRMVELAKYDSFIEFVDNGKGKAEEVAAVEYQSLDNGVMKINVRTGAEGDKGMAFIIPVSFMQDEMNQNPERYEVENREFPAVNTAWITSLFQKPDGKA